MTERLQRTAGAGEASRRRFLAGAAGVLLGGLAGVRAAEALAHIGKVERSVGRCEARRATGRRALFVGAPLYQDERVRTGARSLLVMRLGRETTIRLGPSAELLLDRHLVEAGGELVLQSGPIFFSRPADAPATDTRIRSPFGLVSVRGTRFFAGPSNGVFGVFVAEGRVAVAGGGKTVIVTRGEGTDVARPGAQPTDPARWGRARIDAALRSVGFTV